MTAKEFISGGIGFLREVNQECWALPGDVNVVETRQDLRDALWFHLVPDIDILCHEILQYT